MVCRLSARLGESFHGVSGLGREHRMLCLLSHAFSLIPAASLPFPQGDPGQLDQVSHAGGQEDGLLVTVPSPIIALYLFHHKLGVSKERILCESIQVEHRRRNRGFLGKKKKKNQKFPLGLSKTGLNQTNHFC